MKKLLTLVTALTLVLAIAGCKEDDTPTGPTDAELVAEATTALLLTDLNEVTDDLTLPAGGLHDSVITWSSGDESVVTDAGVVTRPAVGDENAVITLTATITIGDESDTKEFTVRVIAAVPTLDVTLAELNEHTWDATEEEFIEVIPVDADIVVTGVVFGIVEGNGFQISDGTAFVMVYAGTSEGVALGDTVQVTGQKTIYYGLPEVDEVTSVVVLSSGDAQPAYEVTLIEDLFDEDPYDTTYWSKPITITGLVSVDGDGNAVLTATSAEGMAYNIVVYYKSFPAQITALVALAGEMVTVDVIVYGYHDGLGAWRVTVAEDAVVTSAAASDAELALWEAGQLDLGDLTEVTEDLVLNAVGELAGTTVAWASDNEAVISTAGVVDRVAGSDTTVVLTATITVGVEVVTKDFTVTVKDLDFALVTITVAEAIATEAEVISSSGTVGTGAEVVVQGIVTAIIGSSKIVIQDAAGGPGITTYTSGFNNDNTFELGDEIIVRGTHVVYYGLQELTNLVLVSVVSSDNTVQSSTTTTAADIIADLAAAPYALQGLNATLTNLQVIDVDYDAKSGYVVVAPTDDLTSLLIFSAYDIPYSDTLVVGDILTELTVVIWDYYYSATRVIVMEYPGLTDAEALIAAGDALSIPETAIADLDLPLLDEDYAGLTIVWSSDTPLVISDAGVLVQPTEGGDATVVLTATLSLGTETDVVVTFTVTVPQIITVVVPDVFFSEYIEGSSNNKAIEIYNPTDAAILLDGYVINYYNNGAATPTKTYDLAGITLAAGDVYVICTDTYAGPAVCDEIQAWGDADSVVFYNGNDAMELMKDTVSIDVMGVIGVDEYWTVGDAAMAEYTLVRNADVVGPSAIFDPTQWTAFPVDTFEHLGTHPYIYMDVFFSEYIEGSSNNKAIEIYNPTDAAILLDGYVINYYNNGAATPTKTYDLAGITLAAGDVYVICTDTYAGPAVCDEIQAWGDADSVVFYNGNDAMELMKDTVSIDVMGVIGVDEYWTVGDAAMAEYTLVRNADVVGPSAIFDPTQWTAFPVDTFEHLGTHPYIYMDVFFSEYIEGSSNNKAIEIYNPTDAAILLDGYVINYYNNGAATPTKTYDLAGITLAAGDVYVICTDTYAGPAVCDEIQAWGDADSVVFYNGNDAMELMKDTVSIDVMGVIGVDEYWTVGDAAMAEYTLVRVPSVIAPNGIFTPGEWVAYAADTFDYLGSHVVD